MPSSNIKKTPQNPKPHSYKPPNKGFACMHLLQPMSSTIKKKKLQKKKKNQDFFQIKKKKRKKH